MFVTYTGRIDVVQRLVWFLSQGRSERTIAECQVGILSRLGADVSFTEAQDIDRTSLLQDVPYDE
jgi:hypothetical protein